MKSNLFKNKLYWIYLTGFFVILALPILTLPPWFYPPDFGKTIIFRSVLAILLFLFAFQLLYRKNELNLPDIKKNKIIWALAGLFIIFLLASVFSVDPYFSFWGSPYRGGGFVTFAFYFVFAILVFILFKKEDWKKAWIFSIFIGILVSLVAIIQYYGLFDKIFLPVTNRPSSTLGNPILLAIYLLLLFFPTLSFTIKEKNKYLKIFYIFSLLIFLYVIFITGSRAVYLGVFAGMLYFLLFYPKKFAILKILTALFLILVASTVFYVNTQSHFPQVLQNNRLFQILESRLSIKAALDNERFRAWQTVFQEIKDKPILGWGPENFAVGFDKNYDPMVNPSPWWDRAHNIILDIGAQSGILGIIAYLALFVVLFWQLQKLKNNQRESAIIRENTIIPYGIQATLVGYIVANFFSLDSFGTYLIFFLLIAYSLHLNDEISGNPLSSVKISVKPWIKSVIVSVLFCTLILFLWQYNILPFKINAEINKASTLADQKYCGKAFSLMDKILLKHSFLDSYARMEYVEFTKTCNNYFPENNLVYIKRGLELINEAVKIQPLYTRYWLLLGSSTTVLAAQEKNTDSKNNLLKQANYYFDRASQLAPKNQEILVEKAKMEIVAGDYKNAQDYSEKCITLNPNLGDCYWYLALSKIYLKDTDGAQKDIQAASDKKYNINSKVSLGDLSNAYGSISDYQDLVPIYEKLIAIDTNFAQYHSSLAFFYKELGEYDKARQEALKVLQLSPESKQNVDDFLKTLPY